MSKLFSRRIFLAAGFAALAGPLWADAPAKSLRPVARPGGGAVKAALSPRAPSAQSLIEKARLGGKVAYAVADAKSGLVLETRDGSAGQPPASVAKTVTALYALDALGPSYRFETRLIASGAVTGGVLNGDLVLAGGGDPTLDTNTLADLAARLKSAGIRQVRGDFLVWGGMLPSMHEIDRDQPVHVGYNPAVSGLNLNYNRVHFEWKRGAKGYSVTMDARSDRYRPKVSMARMKIVPREAPVYTYREVSGGDQWTVARSALGRGGSRWLPVRQPELYAGEVFRTFARSRGIALGRPKVTRRAPSGVVLARVSSPELTVVLRDMLKYSNNLTAEVVGLAATVKRKGKTTTSKSSAAEMSRWAAATLGMKDTRLVDHSGLGAASRVTAVDMAKLLVSARANAVLKPILKPIAMRHENGKVNKAHPIKVHAKTGTLNFVSALAGYARTPDGTEMAFAILAADQGKRKGIKRADRERPQGARGWNKRAKQLQQKLIERWARLYGG